MVGVSTLLVGLSAVAATLAAPTVEKRGAADFVLHPDHPIARRIGNITARSNPSYTQNYKTGGTVNFSPTGTGFTLNYNVQQDFVVGVGWNPGSNQYVRTLPNAGQNTLLTIMQAHHTHGQLYRQQRLGQPRCLRMEHQPARRVLHHGGEQRHYRK